MTQDPFNFWTRENSDANFSEPGACRARSTRFEKSIRRRNLLEYAAGALVVVVFGALAVFFAGEGEWALSATVAMTVAAAISVVSKLHRDGSAQSRSPEASCKDHLRSQLVRQRDLLRGVPTWYLAPFVPGLVGFYLVVTANVAEVQGWAAALEGVWFKFVATAAFFIFVGWLNLHTARKLDREIAALDRA